jgi:hypothetical protein
MDEWEYVVFVKMEARYLSIFIFPLFLKCHNMSSCNVFVDLCIPLEVDIIF